MKRINSHAHWVSLVPTGCPECARLWEEYIVATTAHVALLDERNAAPGNYDDEFERILRQAERARALCKDVIDRHEAQAHNHTEVEA